MGEPKENNGIEQILQFQPEVQVAIGQRVRAAQLEAEAGALKTSSDQVLMKVMQESGVKTLLHDYGEFQFIPSGVSTSLDKQKLKEVFLDSGVPLITVTSCFDLATKESTRKGYIKFILKSLPGNPPSEMEVRTDGV